MKKTNLIFIVPVIALAFCSCRGNHGSVQGKDTEKNEYGAQRDTSKKADSLPTDTTGIDHSSSGGTTIAKPDSGKNK